MVGPEDLPLSGTPAADLRAIVDAALAAVSADAVVSAAYSRSGWSESAPVTVLAVGKAASAMTHALVRRHGLDRLSGVAIGTHGGAPPGITWLESAHPVPDARSEFAARAAISWASHLSSNDRAVVMVSGGASSLMALPADGLTLADKQAVTARLLAEGTDITAMNCVRKHLSAIKGGRLAQAAAAPVEAWLLSDVVGDDPSVIGSGPTVPDPTTYDDALQVIERAGGASRFPASVVAQLTAGARGERPETPKRAADVPNVATRVIGSAGLALDGALTAAKALGYEVLRRPTPVIGEARIAAADHVAWIRDQVRGHGRRICVLSSGETTVRVVGGGRGGRNQEFALAAALAIEAEENWCLASVGTDGVDGPTKAAGAWIDGGTLGRARMRGLDPMAYLQANDSWPFFDEIGGHVTTGPTDTNVGDIQVALLVGS